MATGTAEFIDSTTADVFIKEQWSTQAIVAREQKLSFARNVDLKYKKDLSIGDIVNVPSLGNLAAQTKIKANNTAVSFETITETNTQITVATWLYSGVAVESIVKIQANMDLLMAYAPKQGYALAEGIDDTLAGHPDDFTNTTGTLGAGSAYTDYVRGIQYLDDAKAPSDGRVIIISPAERGNMLSMKEYVHNDYSSLHGDGPKVTQQEKDYVTSFLGYPVYVTTNAEGTNAAGHDNTMMHKEAIALIVQMEPTPWYMADANFLVHKVVMEELYGSAILRNDHGVWQKGA